jgi:hypothetical protein
VVVTRVLRRSILKAVRYSTISADLSFYKRLKPKLGTYSEGVIFS